MITFDKPKNLNGSELREELRNAGVDISDDILAVTLTENSLTLNISLENEEKARKIVQAHNGTILAPEPTVAEKLASVGLSLDDLKSALGL